MIILNIFLFFSKPKTELRLPLEFEDDGMQIILEIISTLENYVSNNDFIKIYEMQ